MITSSYNPSIDLPENGSAREWYQHLCLFFVRMVIEINVLLFDTFNLQFVITCDVHLVVLMFQCVESFVENSKCDSCSLLLWCC